jgi:hypothetical protein
MRVLALRDAAATSSTNSYLLSIVRSIVSVIDVGWAFLSPAETREL